MSNSRQINVSVVLYNTPFTEVERLVNTLRKSESVRNIYLIDNSGIENTRFRMLKAEYLFNDKNIGYGAAHNIAMRKSIEQLVLYHLVVNADIVFEASVVNSLLEFMNNNADIGQIMPLILYPDGKIQYLCKLLPTPFDLIFRRFLPDNWTKRRTEKFEMRQMGYNKTVDVPYLSGCFMFLRTSSLQQVGLFDERFFMYPEDIDLTRRMHQQFRTVFYPEVSVVHHHAQSSYKDKRMLWIHMINMIKYFNKWGWFFDKERRAVNRSILSKL